MLAGMISIMNLSIVFKRLIWLICGLHKGLTVELRLSKLQKQILRLAYKNAMLNKVGPDLSNRDVLRDIYKFPVRENVVYSTSQPLLFDRKQIGHRRYNSASVATSKTLERLERRGLVDREYNEGVFLTEKGIEVAKGLIGKKRKGRWRRRIQNP